METSTNTFKMKTLQIRNKKTEIPTKLFHEPAPAPVVATPFRKIFTLPWNPPLNQPQVKPHSAENAVLPKTSSSSNRYPEKYSEHTMSYAERSAEADSDSIFSDMFTTTFRKMKNRNRFTSKVFFILGVQTCFSFIVYCLLMYQTRFAKRIKKHWLAFFIIFTCIVNAIVIIMLSCSSYLRKMRILILIFLTGCVTIQGASIASSCIYILQFLLYSSGSTMPVFFIGSVLAAQRKCEATGTLMIVLFLSISVFVNAAVVAILTSFPVCVPRWEVIGTSVFVTLLVVTFVIFLIKTVIQKTDLKASDYYFGALLVYLSITTLYCVKSLVICLRKSKGPYTSRRASGAASEATVATSEATVG